MEGLRPTDRVANIMATPVATIRPTATLREAAVALAADSVGLLVVVDPNGVMGVLSERDIVAAIADDVDLDVERVSHHASIDLVKVTEDEPIVRAAEAMGAAEIRHLAITREDDVIGVVSVRDVLSVLTAASRDAAADR